MDKYIYRGKLDRVIDGDTIDAMIDVGFDIWVKKRIRYMGMDAWESRTRDLEEKKKGLAAKDYVNQMAPVGTKVTVITHKEGKYGRILAEVFIETEPNEWKCINTLLTEEGHATRYPI